MTKKQKIPESAKERLFTYEPFEAQLSFLKGDKRHICTPVIYDTLDIEIGLVLEDGTFIEASTDYVCREMGKKHFIAAWRAIQLLRCMSIIERNSIRAAYHASMRKRKEDEDTKETVSAVGQKNFDRVMALPVPEEIIRLTLERSRRENWTERSPVWSITDEVRAGTIQWRSEFADFGVEYPDKILTRAVVKKRFAKLI